MRKMVILSNFRILKKFYFFSEIDLSASDFQTTGSRLIENTNVR